LPTDTTSPGGPPPARTEKWRAIRRKEMLVLSRKLNEEIVIADNIMVVVAGISGGNVRLGVKAPKEIPIHRREVFDAIHRNELPTSTNGVAD